MNTVLAFFPFPKGELGTGVEKDITFLFSGNAGETLDLIVCLYYEAIRAKSILGLDWRFETSIRLCFSGVNDKTLRGAKSHIADIIFSYRSFLKENVKTRVAVMKYVDILKIIMWQRGLPTEL